MKKKDFWLLDDVEKRADVEGIVKKCFAKHVILDAFAINAANDHGYIIIKYYGDILLNAQLNSFSAYLTGIGAYSSYNMRIKHDEIGTYYISIVYCFKRLHF